MVAPLPAPASVGTSTWVRSPLWDLFWLHGGLWLAPVAVVSSVGWSRVDDSPAQIVYLVLSALFWIGHRFSSTWLAWFTTAYSHTRKAQPVRFFLVPWLVMGLTAFTVLAPDAWLPGTWIERVVALAAVDYFLVTYHFAAQHFGVLSLYRSRSTRTAPARVRTLDRVFALTVGGVVIIGAELIQGATTLPDSWLGPLAGTSALEPLRLPIAGLTIGLTVAQLVVARRHTPGLPRVLYILGLGAMALAALLAHPFVYIFCWTAQHWLAAVGLAAVVAEGEPSPPSEHRLLRFFHAIHRQPGRFLLVLALLSALSMPFYEVEASAGPADRPAFMVLDQFLNGALTAPITLQCLTALGLATAFLHYLLDRAVWRFSDPSVRAAAAPLLRPPPR
jgi:hypothetical protein